MVSEYCDGSSWMEWYLNITARGGKIFMHAVKHLLDTKNLFSKCLDLDMKFIYYIFLNGVMPDIQESEKM